MSDELSKLMSELQRNMGGALIGVGDIAHARYTSQTFPFHFRTYYRSSTFFWLTSFCPLC
jgi:hypothetical protein